MESDGKGHPWSSSAPGLPRAGGSARMGSSLETIHSQAGTPDFPPTILAPVWWEQASLTLPACGTDTGKALIVLGLLAYPTVFAGAGGTWGQHHLTCGS